MNLTSHYYVNNIRANDNDVASKAGAWYCICFTSFKFKTNALTCSVGPFQTFKAADSMLQVNQEIIILEFTIYILFLSW